MTLIFDLSSVQSGISATVMRDSPAAASASLGKRLAVLTHEQQEQIVYEDHRDMTWQLTNCSGETNDREDESYDATVLVQQFQNPLGTDPLEDEHEFYECDPSVESVCLHVFRKWMPIRLFAFSPIQLDAQEYSPVSVLPARLLHDVTCDERIGLWTVDDYLAERPQKSYDTLKRFIASSPAPIQAHYVLGGWKESVDEQWSRDLLSPALCRGVARRIARGNAYLCARYGLDMRADDVRLWAEAPGMELVAVGAMERNLWQRFPARQREVLKRSRLSFYDMLDLDALEHASVATAAGLAGRGQVSASRT